MVYKSKFIEATPESSGLLSQIISDFNKAFKNSVLFVVPEKDSTDDKNIPKYVFAFKYSVKDDPFIEDAIYSGETIVKPSQKAFETVQEVLGHYGFNPSYNETKNLFTIAK